MAFTLPELGYAHNALEPVISEQTMTFHHDKHHQAYVNNLNKALEEAGVDYDDAEKLLQELDKIPEAKRAAVRNNGGGHHNHSLFWETLKPGDQKAPVGDLAKAIEKNFGSVEKLQEEFNKAGAGRFGSGWAYLIVDKNGELKVTSTANQDSPVSEGATVILLNDVWEHAYYLDYQNRRPDYLKEWWKLVNWEVAEARYQKALKK